MQAIDSEKLSSPDEIDVSGLYAPAGSGWKRYDLLTDNHTCNTEWPEAQDMLAIAKKMYIEKRTVNFSRIEPLYIRNNVAEKPKSK